MRSKARNIIQKANNIDIKIVTTLLLEQGLIGKKNPRDTGFLCPYHPEKSGSFMPYKNGYKCFGCEVYATTTKLFADVHLKNHLNNLSKENSTITVEELQEIYDREKHLALWESAVYLCYKEKLISKQTKEEHERLINKCRKTGDIPELYTTKTNRSSFDTSFKTDYEFSNTKDYEFNYELNSLTDIGKKVLSSYDASAVASRRDLNTAYTTLRDCIIEVRGDALLPHHRKHLNEVRFLPDEYIDFYGYFSLPTKEEMKLVRKKVLNRLKSFGMAINAFKVIPGFIYNEDTGMVSLFSLGANNSIGINIDDTWGNKKRIQLRPDTGLKSAWFSTPEAGNCKAPSSVRYPYKKNYHDLRSGNLIPNDLIYTQVDPETTCKKVKNDIAITFTEGDYKAVHSSNLLNIISISTQGLTPWYNMFIEYSRISSVLYKSKELPKQKVNKGLIAFDCDIKFKRGLIDKGKGVHRVLKNLGVDAYYITWKYKYGKGIDDVINNGHSDKLLIVDADVFERKYDLIIELISMVTRKLPIYLEEDDIISDYEVLEEHSVKELEDMLEVMKLKNILIEKMSGKKIGKLKEYEFVTFVNKLKGKTLNELRELNEEM